MVPEEVRRIHGLAVLYGAHERGQKILSTLGRREGFFGRLASQRRQRRGGGGPVREQGPASQSTPNEVLGETDLVVPDDPAFGLDVADPTPEPGERLVAQDPVPEQEKVALEVE